MPHPRASLALLSLLPSFAFAAPACQPGQPIDESGFVKIGGIEQWVTIQGEDEPLTVEQIRDDGLELARHIRQRFGTRKLILMGSSRGSIVGTTMPRKDPGQFCAWVGVAQVVGGAGPAAWTNPRNFGILRRAIRSWKGDGMMSRVDMVKPGTRFELPVYIIQGAEDLLTEAKVTRRYCEAISAPDKAYVEVPRAGHDPNGPLIDAQRRVLDARVRPRCS